MKKQRYQILHSSQAIDIVNVCFSITRLYNLLIVNFLNRLHVISYNFYTGFPQILWKTYAFRAFSFFCALLFCCALTTSCTFFKSSKKGQDSAATESKETKQKQEVSKLSKRALDNYLIDKDDGEVVKRFGEPTIVSRLADNRIMWTYRPSWKLLLDNKDTVYVEFENGKVIKIFRTTK
jgi:hypothetical protein